MGAYPTIIGLTGAAGSGKDTAAAALAERYNFRRVAFGDAVKRVAYATDPLVEVYEGAEPERLSALVEKHGWDGTKVLPDVRRLLQRVGTEGVRDVLGDDTWVKVAGAVVRELIKNDPQARIVFTDVRFENEAAFIRKLGGSIVNIDRPDNPHALSGENAGHASEAPVAADYAITNDGNEQDLAAAIGYVGFLLLNAQQARRVLDNNAVAWTLLAQAVEKVPDHRRDQVALDHLETVTSALENTDDTPPLSAFQAACGLENSRMIESMMQSFEQDEEACDCDECQITSALEDVEDAVIVDAEETAAAA